MCDGRLLAFQDRMDAWPCFWATLMFATLVTATSNCTCVNDTLIVYNTYFKDLRDCICSENYRNLHTIHLANNNLFSLEGTGLSDVSSLWHLLVIQNLLTSLDPHLLSNLTELISLDLSYNELESFQDEQIFASQSKLKVLRLSHNRIVTLDSRVLAPLHALTELILSDNPFCCGCELRHTVKWCEEKKLRTNATCENGVPWTDFAYENCASFTYIVIGIGIGVVIIASVVVEVWVCYLRRPRHATVRSERSSPVDTPDNEPFADYHAIPLNHQTCPTFSSTRAPLLKPTDSSSSLEYARFTQWQDIHHTETSSNPGTGAGVAVSHTYAEPYRHTTDASETYSVPYHHTTARTGESKVSNETVFCTDSNNEVYSDGISVRNSLYLQPQSDSSSQLSCACVNNSIADNKQ